MVRSMTGYGQGIFEEDGISFDLELKSVNSRYFDINIRMPRTLAILEDRIRKKVNSYVKRGKVDLYISYRNNKEGRRTLTLDEDLAGLYIESLKNISNKYNLEGGVSLSLLKDLDGVFIIDEKKEDPEEIFSVLDKALTMALGSHDKMRIKEGENLKEDLFKKGEAIKERTRKIEELAPNMVLVYRERLQDRLNEFKDLVDIDDKLAMEVALFSDRSSIDEEITRLKSHLDQLDQILELDEAIGKKLDFLVQEMNREANTMASKSQDLEITGLVLEIKNEIEKIREQIQNIE